ncbi:hypothetical protein [Raineya orbicola]|uniref:hypothetical protein n=1 Tax=Raineya orbicola TaxID=2016530 RepID=UPI001055E66E|nr:hypothetical protein [Raineya orbicola]
MTVKCSEIANCGNTQNVVSQCLASLGTAKQRGGDYISCCPCASASLRHCVQQEICKILKIFLRFAQKFSELRKSPPRYSLY